MSDELEKNGSPEDEVEEILREYREKKNNPTPDSPDADISDAAPHTESADESGAQEPDSAQHDTTGAFLSHFADNESEHEEKKPIFSHFSDGGDEESTESEEAESAEQSAEPDEYTGMAKPLRILLKAGRALLSMSFLAKALIYFAIVLVISAYLSYYIILLGNDMFALVTDDREINITIAEGATEDEVTELLSSNGLIDSEWFFKIYLDRYASENGITFIPGDHTLNLNMNYSQMMSELTVKKYVRETVTLTFPEGFTVDNIIDLFLEKGIGTREGFIEAINQYPYKHEFVRILDEKGWSKDRVYRLEGYLYPDTYEFYTDTKEYLIINKFLNNFNDRVWVDWKSTYGDICAKENYSLDDIVTLASIVQAEGRTAEDFEYISYVFHNRLKHSDSFPNLESVATIQYALELDGLERIPDAKNLDVNYNSPYNTYNHKGLTPGAICNAGLDAFLAAIYPSPPLDENDEEINAYYFVSNKVGKIYYASSLSRHEKNKAQVEKDNKAAESDE